MLKNKNIIIFSIIFLSLLASILLSFFYITVYDNYQLDQTTHIMLKEETYAHWQRAAKIIEQLKSGTPFFLAGEEVYTKPLPQRIVVLYSIITNFDIINDWTNFRIALGGKLLFLITQSIIYYSSIFYFYKQVSKYFESNINILIILFLCLEPTIFQYHSSFWTESFYFSLQILILSMMINTSEKNIKFISLGMLVGLLFIQRSAGIFYIIVMIAYYFFTIKKNKYKKIFLIILFYSLVCAGLGIHNYKRAGVFYVMPSEGKYSMYKYFAKNILKNSSDLTTEEVNRSEVRRSLKWIKVNIPELNYLNNLNINSPYEIGLQIKSEISRIKYYDHLNKRAYEILLENPVVTIRKILKGFVHFSVLNPFFVYYDYDYYKNYSSSKIGDFVFSDQHKKLIPARIIYTSIIFITCFIGLFECFRKYPKITLMLLFSILYYYIILGWYGKTRLFTPILIYLSIFFGNGSISIFNKIKNIS